MYSNDLTQIRSGFVNYIGASIAASPFEGRAARHSVVAILMEEALNLSQDKQDEPYDLYVLKPMLRATSVVLKQRQAELEKLPRSQEVNAKISEYEQLYEKLDAIIKLINT